MTKADESEERQGTDKADELDWADKREGIRNSNLADERSKRKAKIQPPATIAATRTMGVMSIEDSNCSPAHHSLKIFFI